MCLFCVCCLRRLITPFRRPPDMYSFCHESCGIGTVIYKGVGGLGYALESSQLEKR